VQLAHEVGDENERATQQADDDELVGSLEMRRDLPRQPFDARGNGFGGDEDIDFVGRRGHLSVAEGWLGVPTFYPQLLVPSPSGTARTWRR
jgi:hypothetical protein